ncbi:MAG: zinc ribbon domain-containing protein [Acidobacteriota bacterium]|nr:MAG: zinc ribbon domain-containing protein [Acidobacteriota bacterium]
MPLIHCEECGTEISQKAPICPQCGHPRRFEPFPLLKIPRKKRRGCCGCLFFLLLVALLALAAWLARDRLPEGVREKLGLVRQYAAGEPLTVYDKEVQIPGGNYFHIQLPLAKVSEITLEFEVTSGPAINVYGMDEEGLRAWETDGASGEAFQPLPGWSFPAATEGRHEGALDAGTYYFVADNSGFQKGEDVGGGDNTASVRIKVSQKL